MVRRKERARALGILIIPVITWCCDRLRTPSLYEIPDGFRGWVLMEFKNPACPALERRDGKWVFRVGADGRLCTSTSPETEWAVDKYFFVGAERREIPHTGWGGGGLIWGAARGTCQVTAQAEHEFEKFFVGTETDFGSAPRPPELEGCKS